MQKGGKVFRAQAIPFILINEKRDQNGKTTYQFELHRKAVDIFMAVKNKKIAVATVAGPQRSGKSFLSNRLLKRMTGFAIGPSTMPCTKGLWIWGEPIQISEDSVLMIMDTEGLNSVQRDINVDLKIFSLSVLLSSVFIYNSLGHIDEKALENMSYVLRITENIRMKSEMEAESEISKCFPFFYWVLRDFSLDLKGMTESEYLQRALTPISNDEKDPKNQIRSKIRKLFTQRKCECFPRPINDEDKLAHIEQLHFEDLRQKFRQKMKQFQKTFYQTLPVKLINGKPLTGDIYLNLIRQYLDAMNNGKVPEVLTSLERVLESECRQITEGLANNYRETMNKNFNDKPIDEIIIQRNHREFMRKIQEKIDEKLKNWLDIGRTGEYKVKLLEALEKDYKERLKKNNNLCNEQCSAEFTKFSTAFYELPKMEDLDLVSDSYFKEKFNEFTKAIKSFLQNCKAPRKYIFFIQKFPKATFDFFQLFFARAKGVFNNEVNKLRAEGRNYQSQIESLNRIMKEQQNLLAEKQKEIAAITYQKQALRRQLEKNEKMKEFQKEADKMNKNQLKKTLESYKLNIIDLQNANAEMEQSLQKMRAELSNKKIEITQMVKKTNSVEQSKETHHTDNLPNDLIGTMESIKQKLTAMKQFYDQKASDDSLEDAMLRQIEEMRTEKYKEIQKMKEKYTAMKDDIRKNFTAKQNEYEKNFKLLNSHIDALKIQNMDLQKEMSELIEKKGVRNAGAEIKNLEESLRLKTNIINSNKTLIDEKERKIADLQFKMASLKSEVALLQSYKETFPFILAQSLNWVQGKNNKLKHSVKTLNKDDQLCIKRVFKQLGLNPF